MKMDMVMEGFAWASYTWMNGLEELWTAMHGASDVI